MGGRAGRNADYNESMRRFPCFSAGTLVFLSLAGCYPELQPGSASTPPRRVEVVTLRAEPIADQFTLIGETEPWQEAVLYFEVPGIVAAVHVEEGAEVSQGDAIAQLVTDDYDLAVARAQAEHAAARARWDLLKEGTRKEDLDAAKADHARAQAWLAFWVNELKRHRVLIAKGTTTATELEQVQREHDAAEQEERLTKAKLERAIAGPRLQEIEAAQAEFQAREAAVKIAQRQLAKAALVAPISGRIERRMVDVGAYVNVFPSGGVPIVHLVDLQKVDAVIAVPEVLLSYVVGLDQVDVRSALKPDLRSQARIISVDRAADRETGTYQLRARLANSDGNYTSGMIVTTTISSPASRSHIRIPLTSIRRPYGQPPYVLLVDADRDKVVAQTIEPGPVLGERVEVLEGLESGQLLIVAGQNFVVEGDVVQYE